MPRRGPVSASHGKPTRGDAAFAASIDISPSLSLRLRKLLRSAGRLSGWRRQQRDPAQRPAKQPARQVTLRQEQPIIVAGMLPAGASVLERRKARSRPGYNSGNAQAPYDMLAWLADRYRNDGALAVSDTLPARPRPVSRTAVRRHRDEQIRRGVRKARRLAPHLENPIFLPLLQSFCRVSLLFERGYQSLRDGSLLDEDGEWP